MKICITKEQSGYSAHIAAYKLSTQWESFDELISNIHEAVELYFEEERTYQSWEIENSFYLQFSNFHASELQSIA